MWSLYSEYRVAYFCLLVCLAELLSEEFRPFTFEVIIDKDFHVVLLFCFANLLFLALLCSFLVTFMSENQPLSSQGNKCLWRWLVGRWAAWKSALLVQSAQFSNLGQPFAGASSGRVSTTSATPRVRQCVPVSNLVNRCSASYRISHGGEIQGQQLLFGEDSVQGAPLSQQRKAVKYWSRGTRLRFPVSLHCQCQESVSILCCVQDPPQAQPCLWCQPSPGSMKLWCSMHVAGGILLFNFEKRVIYITWAFVDIKVKRIALHNHSPGRMWIRPCHFPA